MTSYLSPARTAEPREPQLSITALNGSTTGSHPVIEYLHELYFEVPQTKDSEVPQT